MFVSSGEVGNYCHLLVPKNTIMAKKRKAAKKAAKKSRKKKM